MVARTALAFWLASGLCFGTRVLLVVDPASQRACSGSSSPSLHSSPLWIAKNSAGSKCSLYDVQSRFAAAASQWTSRQHFTIPTVYTKDIGVPGNYPNLASIVPSVNAHLCTCNVRVERNFISPSLRLGEVAS